MKRMLFGHNTNVTVGDVRYHVQTEDRGEAHALIDTTVYLSGRVLHRRTSNYQDLLPIDAAKEPILKQRVDEQHHRVETELRAGELKMIELAAAPATAPDPASATPQLRLRIHNAVDWLKGKHASLRVGVRDELGNVLARARVAARMEGTSQPVEIVATAGEDGVALLEFEMPKFVVAEPALVVEAKFGPVQGRLRMQLKAKAKVPTA